MKIEVDCETCGQKFLREKGEYNRSKKLGRGTYCSRSCNGKKKANLDRIYKYGKELTDYQGYDRSDEYTPFRWYMKTISNSNRVGKHGDVDLEYLKDVWEEQNGRCPFTGFEMELRTHSNCNEPLSPYHASVDRIDNDRGYEKGNVRFVSAMANMARNKWTDEEVISFCCAVVEQHIGRV